MNQPLTGFKDTNGLIIKALLPNFNETFVCQPDDSNYTGIFSTIQAETTFGNLRALVALSKTCTYFHDLCNEVYQEIFKKSLKDRVIESAALYWSLRNFIPHNNASALDTNKNFIKPIKDISTFLEVTMPCWINNENNGYPFKNLANILDRFQNNNFQNICFTPSIFWYTLIDYSASYFNQHEFDILFSFCTDQFGTSKRTPFINLLKPLRTAIEKDFSDGTKTKAMLLEQLDAAEGKDKTNDAPKNERGLETIDIIFITSCLGFLLCMLYMHFTGIWENSVLNPMVLFKN